jgi:hypothetical protein
MAKRQKLPDDVLNYFRKHGRAGGKKRAERLSPERRREIARKAIQTRWKKKGKGK